MSYTVCLTDNPYLAVRTPPVRTLPLADRVQFALHYAALAPSIHNSQPWRFRTDRRNGAIVALEVYADLGRDLPALDALHRQLIISCGTATAALQIGLASLGVRTRTDLFPRGESDGCVARINVLGDISLPDEHNTASRDALRAHQLPRRRTYRARMTEEPTAAQMRDLAGSVFDQDLTVLWIPDRDERHRLGRLVAMATLTQASDSSIAHETSTWTSRQTRARDGVPPANWQRTSVESAMAPIVQRDFALGRSLPSDPPLCASTEGTTKKLLDVEPGLAALCSARDTPRDWLRTGEALMRFLLDAETEGLAVGYVNQPIEVPRLREILRQRLSKLAGWHDEHPVPQMLLRVGKPADGMPPASPRRTVSEMLIQACHHVS